MDGLEKPEQHVLGIHTERRSGGLGMPKRVPGEKLSKWAEIQPGQCRGSRGAVGRGQRRCEGNLGI